MDIEGEIKKGIKAAVLELYGTESHEVKLESTNPDFEGDYTYVVFPLLRVSRKKPEDTATDIGNYLISHSPAISSFNVVKGFLNLVVQSQFWPDFLDKEWDNISYGIHTLDQAEKVMVEYSSPNTNKPLHLGHIRNNLLGFSIAEIIKANGFEVIKANLINDRGIHICKSMLAWKLFGNGETPLSSGLKGDHLVGKYYVAFDKKYKLQIAELIANGATEEDAEKQAPLILETQEMLRKWESGDAGTLELWRTMNGWVYEGFEKTYTRLGVDFDKKYYESDTYKLGKDLIEEGLESGVFFKKEDGSVWIDLTEDGLDQKLVLRKDGTSVYITQDIGTADEKYKNFGMNRSIYVVGNEQDYHFKVLFLILKKLGKPYASGLHHLSYGMVDLPQGKMKSREGTVVDADDLMDEMYETAQQKTIELGKTEGLAEIELHNLYESLGMAALKFFILKVDPKKRMLFNPQESIDFQGDTGPFVLYTYARIQSMLRKSGDSWQHVPTATQLHKTEKEALEVLHKFPNVMAEACREFTPSDICHYALNVSKAFNRVYNELTFLHETDATKRATRFKLAHFTANNLKTALGLLGIKVVERM